MFSASLNYECRDEKTFCSVVMHREGWAHTCSNGKTNNSSHKMRLAYQSS